MALALARDASGPHGCLSAWPNATRRIRLFRSSICAAAAGACSGDTLVQFNGATFTGVGVVRACGPPRASRRHGACHCSAC